MGEKIKVLFQKPIYPYLLGLFYIVYRSSFYFYSFKITSFIILLVLYFSICFLIGYFLNKVFKLRNYSLAIFFFFIPILFFGEIFIAIEKYLPFFWIRHRNYLIGAILLFAIVLLIENTAPLTHFLKKITPVLNTFLLIACFVSIIKGFSNLKNTSNSHLSTKYVNLKKKTDIIWILMDEYPSSYSLQKYFNFKNPLDTFLTNKNFISINNIKSRKSFTLPSINTIFNYNDTGEQKSYSEIVDQLEHNAWENDLKKCKYTIKSFDFLKIGDSKNVYHLFAYPTNYFEEIISGTFIYGAINAIFDNEDNYNKQGLELLNRSLSNAADSSLMIWAHFYIPHLPFYRDKSGTLQDISVINPKSQQLLKERFIEYLQYGNTQLMKILNTHSDIRNKIVIISGDHGIRYDFVDKADFYKPYCAIYMPDAYDTTTLRNIKYISEIPDFIMKHLSK